MSSIWRHDYAEYYEDGSKFDFEPLPKLDRCQHCSTGLLHDDEAEASLSLPGSQLYAVGEVLHCPACGWWTCQFLYRNWAELGPTGLGAYRRASGELLELDLTDITIPLGAVRQYIAARYERRFELHPKILEDVVASVFGDHGYTTHVTAYQKDGGIDVVLDDGSSRVGVQVKRWKGAIEAEQIRALTGALKIGGYTRGVFVTTSRFTRGASDTALRSGTVGVPIDLLDADAFLTALRIANIASYDKLPPNERPWRPHVERLSAIYDLRPPAADP